MPSSTRIRRFARARTPTLFLPGAWLRPLWGTAVALGLCALLSLPSASAQVPDPDGSVRFIALGDWGRDGQDFQKPVAEQMGRVAAAERSQFVIALGDNFYNDGVPDVRAAQWKTSFEQIYTAGSLQIPWYAVLGNHDYSINAQAQVEYTLFSPRWKMPARYYTVTRWIDSQDSVEFFILDTSPYVESYRRAPGGYGDLLTQQPDEQTRWLEAALKKSTARWKIVCAHHPIHSSRGKEGDTPELIARIKPLLEKYGVQIFLNGHEHDLQHVRVDAVNYFCSGAGSKTQPGTRNGHTLFSLGDTGGFLAVSITAREFRGRFINYNGREVYAVALPWAPVAPNDRPALQ